MVTEYESRSEARRMSYPSVPQLMEKRLETRSEDGSDNRWNSNSFRLRDAVAYGPDGEIKLILDTERRMEFMEYQDRYMGKGVVLRQDDYNALGGEKFNLGELESLNEGLSKGKVMSHPIWQILVGDQALLGEYIDYAVGNNGSSSKIFMPVLLEDVYRGVPEIRRLSLGPLRSSHLDGFDRD